jgi:hypothetical protein
MARARIVAQGRIGSSCCPLVNRTRAVITKETVVNRLPVFAS